MFSCPATHTVTEWSGRDRERSLCRCTTAWKRQLAQKTWLQQCHHSSNLTTALTLWRKTFSPFPGGMRARCHRRRIQLLQKDRAECSAAQVERKMVDLEVGGPLPSMQESHWGLQMGIRSVQRSNSGKFLWDRKQVPKDVFAHLQRSGQDSPPLRETSSLHSNLTQPCAASRREKSECQSKAFLYCPL